MSPYLKKIIMWYSRKSPKNLPDVKTSHGCLATKLLVIFVQQQEWRALRGYECIELYDKIQRSGFLIELKVSVVVSVKYFDTERVVFYTHVAVSTL